MTALKWFGIEADACGHGQTEYNDIVRWVYDTLFHMNIECDFIWPESENLDDYKIIVVPALYAATDTLLEKLCQYVENGGHLAVTFKTGFANENLKVSHEVQPRILRRCLGIKYHQFTLPGCVTLSGRVAEEVPDAYARVFMELLIPDGAEVLASYSHCNWKEYAAITRYRYKKGSAVYIGCMTSESVLANVFDLLMEDAGMEQKTGNISGITVRNATNEAGHAIHFYFNYSSRECTVPYNYEGGTELLTDVYVKANSYMTIGSWNVKIIEEYDCEEVHYVGN